MCHRAHQHLYAGDGIQLRKRHTAQAAALVHAQLYNFYPALGERLTLDKAGKLQKTEYLAGSGKLRVDAHGKAQIFAHQKKLLGILIAAHARYGVQAGVQPLCHKAAQNVGLIRAGGGYQQLGAVCARLAQRGKRRGVAGHGQKVVLLQAAAQNVAVRVYHNKLMPLAQKLARQRKAHLSVARNDNFHVQALLSAAPGTCLFSNNIKMT